jgi:1-pyrroline-5-carboxylate dehydrogenase
MLKGFSYQSGKRTSKGYAPNSPEKQPFKQLILKCGILKLIYRKRRRTGNTKTMSAPHDHKHIVVSSCWKPHIEKAIANALESRSMGKHGLGQRAAIFLKAAELIAGPYRARTRQQWLSIKECWCFCELIDFYVLM